MDYLRKAVGDARAESKNNRETNGFQSVNGSTGLPQFTHTGSDNRWSMQSLVRTCFLLLSCMLMISGPVIADDAMFIDENGNVGIGTTEPKAKLAISGGGTPTSPNGQLKIGDGGIIFGGPNKNGYQLDSAQISAGQHVAESLNIVGMGKSAGNRKIDIWNEGGLTTRGNVYMIGGNVGIGTTEPKAKLDVNGGLDVKGRIKSKMWNVTQLFNSRLGPLPLESKKFETGGGTLLVIASGSGWSDGIYFIGMDIYVDGVIKGTAKCWTNETGSHKAFTTNPLVVTGVPAGKQHTIKLTNCTKNTITDVNDIYNVTVLELPF